jgi:hypothetical protein
MVRKVIAWTEVAGGTLGLFLLAYLTFRTGVPPTAAVVLPALSGFIFTIAAGLPATPAEDVRSPWRCKRCRSR